MWKRTSVGKYKMRPKLILDPIFANNFAEKDIFSHIFQLQGEIFRQHKNRKTFRFTINNESYFIKLHHGIGWRELCKHFFKGRFPVLSASTERRAISQLTQLNIPVPQVVGYGRRGWNPASLDSFIITKELVNTVSLEEYCKDWHTHPPAFKTKFALIKEVARIAQILHENNINHRDFYICHFLLDVSGNASAIQNPKLYLIDLHRTQLHHHFSQRWIVNDLSRLYFSIMDFGLTQRDILRFITYYSKKPLQESLHTNKILWKKISNHALRLYKKINRQKKDSVL